MLHYERFQETVINEAGAKAGAWKHLLPAIPIAYRNRFMYTLRKGFSIPSSFDMVMLSQTMLDKDYELFVQQAIATKIANREKPDEGRVDKFTIND